MVNVEADDYPLVLEFLVGDSVELPKWLNYRSGIKKSAKRWQFLAGGGEP